MNYIIANKIFEINDKENILKNNRFFKEIDLYEKTTKEADVIVDFVKASYFDNIESKYNSPKIYFDNRNENEVYIFHHSYIHIFRKNGKINVKVYIIKNKSIIKKFYTKFRSMGFESTYDIIGQIFHEVILTLVLLGHYSTEISFIHGSTIYNKEKKQAFIVSGVGGVGKTTIELNFLLNYNKYGFMSDDIGFIDNNGYAYANFNYPKIYGYNAINSQKINRIITKNISFMSNILWQYRYKKSSQWTRRRISPKILSNNNIYYKAKVNSIYYLHRKNIKKLEIVNINEEDLGKILQDVIITEYFNQLFRYTLWHDINNIIEKKDLIYDAIMRNILNVYNRFLYNIEKKYMIFVPYKYKLKELERIIINEEKK